LLGSGGSLKARFQREITLKSYKLAKTFLDKYTIGSLCYGHLGDRGKRDGEFVERWLVNGRLGCNMTPVVFKECNNKIMRAVTIV